MSEIKRIDIREFRKLGFLQEANRLFFHPHGLALEVTTVDEGGDDGMRQRIRGALLRFCGVEDTESAPFPLDDLAEAVLAELFPVGSARLSGIWDYRDDPEGIVFGSGGHGDSHDNAERVVAEREKHRPERERLFGTGEPGWVALEAAPTDVEPLDWTYPEQ